MIRFFLIPMFFLPFVAYAGFWDSAGQSDFFKRVNERYLPNIPTGFFESKEARSASASAFISQLEDIKRGAKEKAGIDLAKFFRWLANSLSKFFSWLAAFLSGLALR